MRLIPYKCFKQLTIAPRWSTLLPLLFYLIFIAFILHMTLPLRSSKNEFSAESSSQLFKDVKNVHENRVDDVDDSENKLVEKAKSLGIVDNANEILGELFIK